MPQVTFDGPNRYILVEAGVLTLDVQRDLYSEWKRWVASAVHANYPAAFRTIGGDPLGGGLLAGAFFFVQNQDGWRIRPAETNHDLVITGNLYAEQLTQPVFLPTLGGYTVTIRMQTSSLTQGVDGAVPATLEAIRNKTDLLKSWRNQVLENFTVVMIDEADHVTPKVGLTVTGWVSVDAEPFVALSNAITEVGQGVYRVTLTAAETNGEVVTLRLTAPGADPRYLTLLPER